MGSTSANLASGVLSKDAYQWQTRMSSPAPTVMAQQDRLEAPPAIKRPFMSKLFGRKKSKSTLHRTITMQTVTMDNDQFSPEPSRSATPAPLLRRTTSPFNDLTNGRTNPEDRPPIPQLPPTWTPFSASPGANHQHLREGAQTSLSTYTTTKKPKTKRSFSALANLFKLQGGQASSPTGSPDIKQETRRKRRGTMKSTFSTSRRVRVSSCSSSFGTLHVPENGLDHPYTSSRARASTILTMPPHPPSIAMLFDASQAEAYSTSNEQLSNSPITYTPMQMLPGLPSFSSKAQAGSSQSSLPGLLRLSKSKSSPDLFSAAQKQSYPSSPSFPPTAHSRAPSRAAVGDPSVLPSRLSLAGPSRASSFMLSAPNPPIVPKSPMSFKMSPALPGLSPKPGKSTFTFEHERSRSPAPSTYAMSTVSKKANKTYLDQVLDLDLGSMAIPAESAPWAFGLDSDDEDEAPDNGETPPKRSAGLRVKVAKELRPNTAGTFGRPQTGNRPNTGVSSRPDTAVTDRPDTGMSTFLGAGKHKPTPLKLDGRLRRLSTVSASEDHHSEHEADIESSLPSAATQDSQLSFKVNQFLDKSVDSDLKVQDDSGFDDPSASKQLNISALGQIEPRRLSTGPPLSSQTRKVVTKNEFRPTTADTTHLPLDLPDIDIAFDPRASLGSLGRQSSVTTLSHYDNNRKILAQSADARADGRKFVTPHVAQEYGQGFDATPRKSALEKIPVWKKSNHLGPVISMTETTSSVSSSVMARIMSRKHLEESMFASKKEANSTPSRNRAAGAQSEPRTPAIVMTFADTEAPVPTPLSAHFSQGSRLSSELAAAETARINDPFDPYGDSYFPPVKSLLPHSPFPSSGSTSGPPSIDERSPANEPDIVKRLLEQLEEETTRRETLEYSLASLRESTGADLRRSDQRIKDLTEENESLRLELAKFVNSDAQCRT